MPRIAIFAGCIMILAAMPALAQSKAVIQKLDDGSALDVGELLHVLSPQGFDCVAALTIICAGRQHVGIFGVHRCDCGGVPLIEGFRPFVDVKPLGRSTAREIGSCSFRTKAQPPQDGLIKYAVVWEKEAGQWKLLEDIWNTNK